MVLVAGTRTAKTKYINNTLDPEWDETLKLDVDDVHVPLRLIVNDQAMLSINNTPIGDAEVNKVLPS